MIRQRDVQTELEQSTNTQTVFWLHIDGEYDPYLIIKCLNTQTIRTEVRDVEGDLLFMLEKSPVDYTALATMILTYKHGFNCGMRRGIAAGREEIRDDIKQALGLDDS